MVNMLITIYSSTHVICTNIDRQPFVVIMHIGRWVEYDTWIDREREAGRKRWVWMVLNMQWEGRKENELSIERENCMANMCYRDTHGYLVITKHVEPFVPSTCIVAALTFYALVIELNKRFGLVKRKGRISDDNRWDAKKRPGRKQAVWYRLRLVYQLRGRTTFEMLHWKVTVYFDNIDIDVLSLTHAWWSE